MAGPNDILRVAHGAIRANRLGIHTVGENIANANTPGYHRREFVYQTANPIFQGGFYLGQGVESVGARRIIDNTLNARRRAAHSDSSSNHSRARILAQADAMFGDLQEFGVTVAMDNLFNSFDQLAAQPQDQSIRSQVLAAAGNLAGEISGRATDLREIRESLNELITSEVKNINGILREIAGLNKAIVAEFPPANDLLDRRDGLINELSELIGIQVLDHGNGSVDIVTPAGFSLVLDTFDQPLTAALSVGGTMDITSVDGGGLQTITNQITGGSLGGMLAARDQDLQQTLTELDQFAFDLATAINTVHAAGVGLDLVTGRDLFQQPLVVAGAAQNFAVDAAVAGNPDAIAAAANVLPVATPGDNTNALALSAIRDTNISGANDPGEALRSVLGNFADRVKDTENALITSEATASHLDVLQQTVSGVSLDEEMLTLMQFREAFSAAAQVAKAADEMMAEIISLKR